MPPARIPIWVGGISDAALRRAARNDGWLSDLQSTAEIEACIDKVRGFRAEQGRADEPFDVMASASDAFTLDGYRRLAKAGVTHVLTLPWIFTHGDTKVLGRRRRHAPLRRRRDRKDLSGDGGEPWPRSSEIPMVRSAWSSAAGSC